MNCDHARVRHSHLPPPVCSRIEKLNRMEKLKSIIREIDTRKHTYTWSTHQYKRFFALRILWIRMAAAEMSWNA